MKATAQFFGVVLVSCSLALLGCGGDDAGTGAQTNGGEGTDSVVDPTSNNANRGGDTDVRDHRTADLVTPAPINSLSDLDMIAPKPSFVEARKIKQDFPNGDPHLEMTVLIYKNGPNLFDGDYVEYHPGGEKWKQGKYKENRRIGEWEFWSDDGTLAKHAFYKDGVPDGEWVFFRDDSTKRSVENWQAGIKNGKWTNYGEDGVQVLLEQIYQDDKLHGKTVRWFPQDDEDTEPQTQLEADFVDGEQHGTTTEWHANGQMMRRAEFKNGKRHGQAQEWDEDGTITQDLRYEDGELVQDDP